MEQQHRAQVAMEPALELVEETAARRRRFDPSRQFVPLQPCPICLTRATLTDWRPRLKWITVEGCLCHGFFVWTPLLDGHRLTRLTEEERITLSEWIRALRG